MEYLVPVDADVFDLMIMEWRIGRRNDTTVSKGIRVGFNLPQVERDVIKDLVGRKKVNSWIVKVSRRSLRGTGTIGHFRVPFLNPGFSTDNTFRFSQMKGAYFKVYYSSAAMSTRFENFICPAFGHRSVVTDITAEEVRRTRRTDKIYTMNSESYFLNVKVEPFGYRPVVLNGGPTLKGDYYIDIALYNDKDKKILSSYYRIPQFITIVNEREERVPSECLNFRVPDRDEDVDPFKKFKFGR
jgi:hypothetical protein